MFSLCNWKFQGCQLQCRFCGEYEIFLHNSCSMRDRNKILLSLLRNEDLNWPFKLLKIITLIISLDMRDLPLQMDIIQRKLRKTIWNSHFPMTQTVCRQKCSLNFLSGIFKIKFAFFRNHFELHIGHWFLSDWFLVRRFCFYQVRQNSRNFDKNA